MHGFNNVDHVCGWELYSILSSIVHHVIALNAFVTWHQVEKKTLVPGDIHHCCPASQDTSSRYAKGSYCPDWLFKWMWTMKLPADALESSSATFTIAKPSVWKILHWSGSLKICLMPNSGSPISRSLDYDFVRRKTGLWWHQDQVSTKRFKPFTKTKAGFSFQHRGNTPLTWKKNLRNYFWNNFHYFRQTYIIKLQVYCNEATPTITLQRVISICKSVKRLVFRKFLFEDTFFIIK